MRLKILLTSNNPRDDENLLHDIHMWFQYVARGNWSTSEHEDSDGRTLLIVDFHNLTDAFEFQNWRGIHRRIRRN
jgi:hypothetical protein